MTIKDIKNALRRNADQKYIEQLKRLGVQVDDAIGVRMPKLRMIAKNAGTNQELAEEVWDLKTHEARILAGLIANPAEFTKEQAHAWIQELKSWDEVDQMCGYLMFKLPFAKELSTKWVKDKAPLVRRAGFVVLVATTIHKKDLPDKHFDAYFKIIEKHATDDANMVKKSVNWLLRQIGKRNIRLREKALACAERLMEMDDKTARWIAKDAIKELNSEEVIARLEKKEEKRLKKLERQRKKEERAKLKAES